MGSSVLLHTENSAEQAIVSQFPEITRSKWLLIIVPKIYRHLPGCFLCVISIKTLDYTAFSEQLKEKSSFQFFYHEV